VVGEPQNGNLVFSGILFSQFMIFRRGVMPDILNKANVSIVERNFCNVSYGGIITYGMVCANGMNELNQTTDVCQGGETGI
jgi:hypothetical protein